ncbi:MFS transporter [Dethiosulfatarculus sandiegensis]|uniref:MFS transporter n=1 Tax=Dethiosulfatarculus sandiegensis TaxID=1429043 RepID=UPI001E549AD3|nr:MFS transporter [Dethiosulfatarculus sandiegensis]
MLIPLILMVGVFFLNFLSRVVMGPLLPLIEMDLHLTHSQAGSLLFFLSLGYFITLLASGFVSQKLDHRRTMLISCLGVGVATLGLSVADSLWSMRLGLFGLGMAAGPYLPSAIAVLTHIIPCKYWGRALAIHETAPNAAMLVAPLSVEFFFAFLSWRSLLLAYGLLSLCVFVGFLRWGPQTDLKGQAPSPRVMAGLLTKPQIFGMCSLFVLGASVSLGVYTILPLYLVSAKEMAISQVNYLIFYCRIPSLIIVFGVGWVNDRLGPMRTLAIVMGIAGAFLALLALADASWVWIVVCVQSPVAGCFFLPALSAAARMGPPSQRNLVVSICSAGGILFGAGVTPAFVGWMGTKGQFDLAFILLGLAILLGLLLLPLLRTKEDPLKDDSAGAAC